MKSKAMAFDPLQLAFTTGQEVYKSGLLWAINGRRFAAGLGPVGWPKVGTTPCEEVWRDGALRLLRYASPVEKPTDPPRPAVLLVCSLINRAYILDLIEERSVVRRLLDQGLDVWLLDWGAPGPADAERGLADYALRQLPAAVQQLCTRIKGARPHVLGYCMGGTLALMSLAAGALDVASLVAMATPVDFHDEGLLSRWCRTPSFNAAELHASHGNIPPYLLQPAFKMLDPVGLSTKLVHLQGKVEDDMFLRFFLAMETWLEDSVSFPGRAFAEWVGAYRDNSLVRGALRLDGKRVDLAKVRCPVLSIVAEKDYITPPASSAALRTHLRPPAQELRMAGGHIGLSTGTQAHRELWPQVARWMIERSGSAAGRDAGASRSGARASKATRTPGKARKKAPR